tara:strand:+ start:985 stop:1191 length:207 start_codon:yes stop_codon:yes gene_type:complete
VGQRRSRAAVNAAGKCELRQFDMDTKTAKSEADKRSTALKVRSLIEAWQPSVVITAQYNLRIFRSHER